MRFPGTIIGFALGWRFPGMAKRNSVRSAWPCRVSSLLLMGERACANCAANGGEANGDERDDLQRPTNTGEWAHMQLRAAVIDAGCQWPSEVYYSDARIGTCVSEVRPTSVWKEVQQEKRDSGN
jgi:hypothetical protein